MGSEASLLDIERVILEFYGEDVVLPKKKPRAVNGFNVFSENKKLINESLAKLVPGEVITKLTPQSLSEEYKAHTEKEDVNLERLKAEKQTQVDIVVEEDALKKPLVVHGRISYVLSVEIRKYGYQFAGVLGRKTSTKTTALSMAIGDKFHYNFV